MHINVNKLNKAGWIVEIDQDQEHIIIHPKHGIDRLFQELVKLFGNPDLNISIEDAECTADKTVREIQKVQIWNLVD